MKNTSYLFFALLMVFSSCSSIKVISDTDESADFTTYKTFGFMPWSNSSKTLVNGVNRELIREAIKFEMENRGYEFVEGESDLSVNAMIILERESAVASYNDYYGNHPYGYTYYGVGFGYSATSYEVYDVWKGTLIIDVFDAKQKKLIWQGSAIGKVNEGIEDRKDNIDYVMKFIYKKYPLKPRKK
ncbi:DUF4136 domain-containing protein [Flammeovirgaceae bacterium SG7u.111]|nr:DUF4136 domain-containing protein [Flammeovirgaceae bacterium SG7u.132]WPO33966.1 DUF4136 domain-containing protein [Flammeovirgaceae bacterium SG7u.111]